MSQAQWFHDEETLSAILSHLLALCRENPSFTSQIASNAELSLPWRHDELDGVSNNRRPDCLLNRLFRRRSKKISKLRVTGLCEGNPSVTGGFPSQRATNAENVSIWWRHRATCRCAGETLTLMWCYCDEIAGAYENDFSSQLKFHGNFVFISKFKLRAPYKILVRLSCHV